MKFSVRFEDKDDLETYIALVISAVTDALKVNLLTIGQSQRLIFRPYFAEKLKDLEVKRNIINLILLGCELEDIQRLVPEALQESIEEIRKEAENLLNSLKEKNETKKETDHKPVHDLNSRDR